MTEWKQPKWKQRLARDKQHRGIAVVAPRCAATVVKYPGGYETTLQCADTADHDGPHR